LDPFFFGKLFGWKGGRGVKGQICIFSTFSYSENLEYGASGYFYRSEKALSSGEI